jgi:peptidoglycan/LPS O-acetylase OafA/YrhL
MSPAALLRRLAWPSDPGAFRLWLALLIVVHHLTRLEIGKAPVLVFFVLSGFWVHRVWHDRYRHARQPWLTFVVSRWWRIAPLLVLATPLAIAMQVLTGDHDLAIVAQTPLAHILAPFAVLGYAQLPTRPVGPAWSLDIEMQFYLVAPLLIALVARLRTAVVLTLGFLVFEWSLVAHHGVVLTSFLPWFLIGMVAAAQQWRPSETMATASMALALALFAAILVTPSLRATYLDRDAPEYVTLNLLLGALLIPFALATVTGLPRPDRADAMLADQSYLVYMLHWPAITLFRHIPWATPFAATAGAFALMGLVVALSLLVWHGYDRPLDRARKRWVDARVSAEFNMESGADLGEVGVASLADAPGPLLVGIDKRS